MTLPMAGPRGLTQATADALDGLAEVRAGTVSAVTSRGIDVQVAEGLIASAAHLDSYNPAVGDPVVCAVYRDSWTVLGRPVGPGTATDLATVGSGVGLTVLGGKVLSGGGATMASSTGSVVVVPRYGVSYHHPPGHWVLLLCGISWYSSVTNDWMSVALVNTQSGAAVGSVELVQAGSNAFGHFETWSGMVPPAYGGVRRDIHMTLQRISGTGASRIDDVAARRGYLVAVDLGDQSVVTVV